MAHTKAQRAVRGNRDSISKRRGIKIYGDQVAEPGNIIVRQKGTLYHPGNNVLLARDFTLMSLVKGMVKFYKRYGRRYVSVIPQ
ncbi:MAG: 50S ribosomal protein L27 [Candidatus Roizmanbacteria bacterium]